MDATPETVAYLAALARESKTIGSSIERYRRLSDLRAAADRAEAPRLCARVSP